MNVAAWEKKGQIFCYSQQNRWIEPWNILAASTEKKSTGVWIRKKCIVTLLALTAESILALGYKRGLNLKIQNFWLPEPGNFKPFSLDRLSVRKVLLTFQWL